MSNNVNFGLGIQGNQATECSGESISNRSGLYRRYGKRSLELLLVLMSAPFVIPIVLFVALIVALDGSSPFYRQVRIGRGGKLFTMVKIRTMVADAETMLEEHLARDPDARSEWDNSQKLKRDPRITAFGRMLRKSSLDELPQLWNVFWGDMALIGPRPMMANQKSLYPGQAYYRLRPGITGPWQVSDRNHCSFASRAQFDAAYEKDLSFRSDMMLMFRTVCVMLRCTGY